MKPQTRPKFVWAVGRGLVRRGLGWDSRRIQDFNPKPIKHPRLFRSHASQLFFQNPKHLLTLRDPADVVGECTWIRRVFARNSMGILGTSAVSFLAIRDHCLPSDLPWNLFMKT